MRLTVLIRNHNYLRNITRRGYAASQTASQKSPSPAAQKPAASASDLTSKLSKVTGLSQNVLTTNEPVGPGASRTGEYKVPEYFNYNQLSYYEAEVEMAKYRCPQPSAVRK